LTKSPIAIAPTKEANLACSPFSSLAPSLRTLGLAFPAMVAIALEVPSPALASASPTSPSTSPSVRSSSSRDA
jgi:hypothetical protein